MRLAIFQSACAGLSREERLARLDAALAANPADLVVCPELFATGYNRGAALAGLAEPADGRLAQAAGRIARAHGTALILGYPEAAEGGPYNAALCLGPDGAIRANHRKRLNCPNSFEEDTFATGIRPTLFTLGQITVAVLICFEVELPETVREAARLGADLVAVPTALADRWGFVAETMIPTRAFENGIWLAYANHGGAENGLSYLGGSRIVAPDGRLAACAGPGEETILARIDSAAASAARARLPYLDRAARLAALARS